MENFHSNFFQLAHCKNQKAIIYQTNLHNKLTIFVLIENNNICIKYNCIFLYYVEFIFSAAVLFSVLKLKYSEKKCTQSYSNVRIYWFLLSYKSRKIVVSTSSQTPIFFFMGKKTQL